MGITESDSASPHVRFVDRQGNHHYDQAWKQQVVSAALEPGASLSRIAITCGVNANLVRKWVHKHKVAQMAAFASSPLSGSAFIPVRIEDTADAIVSRRNNEALNLKVGNSGEMRQASETSGRLSSVAQLNVSLPNGVKLSLECDDVHALTAVIGAVSDV